MRLIDADELKKCVLKWLQQDPCGREEKEFPFETDICVSMLMEIDEQPTITPEPHWIPVTERLPEIRHDVLFTVFFHETWRTMQGYRQDGEFMFWYNGRLETALDNEHRVSAWTPLPEPMRMEKQ